jgi:hypothetical protein
VSTRRRHGIAASADGEATASQNQGRASLGNASVTGCRSARALLKFFAWTAAMPSRSCRSSAGAGVVIRVPPPLRVLRRWGGTGVTRLRRRPASHGSRRMLRSHAAR